MKSVTFVGGYYYGNTVCQTTQWVQHRRELLSTAHMNLTTKLSSSKRIKRYINISYAPASDIVPQSQSIKIGKTRRNRELSLRVRILYFGKSDEIATTFTSISSWRTSAQPENQVPITCLGDNIFYRSSGSTISTVLYAHSSCVHNWCGFLFAPISSNSLALYYIGFAD